MSHSANVSLTGTTSGNSMVSHPSILGQDSGDRDHHQAVSDEVPVIIVPIHGPVSEKPTPPPGVWCKKRNFILALAIPFVLACTFRVFLTEHNMEMPALPVIQRVVDVNGPPIDLPDGHTMATLQQQQPQQSSSYNNPLRNAPTNSFSRSAMAKMEDNQQTLPVVIDRGEVIPAGVGGKKLSAAEALLCRDSVINYVINATNGKDECTGLQKAFDETCSQEEEQQEEDNLRAEDQNEIWLGKDAENNNYGGRRRRLTTTINTRQPKQERRKRRHQFSSYKGFRQELEAFKHKAKQDMYWVMEFIPGVFRPKFFAEEKVFRAYRKLKRRETAIANRRRRILLKRKGLSNTIRRQLELFEAAPGEEMEDDDESNGEKAEDDDGGDGDTQDDDDNTSTNSTSHDENPETEAPVVTQPKPHTILSLPTGHTHVSAKTLEKTLLLQQEDKVLSQVKKAVNATVNATKIDPKEDAAASAKAMADTNELVAAVLNDPTSIEARACCASILNVYHENCNVDAEEEISDKRLFIVVLIMAFCGMVKSLIRHFKIRWLPEAAGCILVGVASGYAASYFPHQDFSFDGNWFLRILVPPIVFEAALSIDKKSFNRHLVPILIYSTIGTVLATFLTATIVHNGTHWLGRYCETIPYIESLIFGALISSIDPIAVLSVLGNMGMNDTDTLYILVFGESLLNDGVAIVLFHTLVEFLDANKIIDSEEVVNAVIHFMVVALGSVLVGIGSGIMCTIYYWAFHGCQTPLVEVLMFLCWALFPYYVCDGIGWSGIVSAVTVGFLMDMYVIGLHDDADDISEHSHGESDTFHYEKKQERLGSRPIFTSEGHLSAISRMHIHFVTEIVATMMETAIFAYLGLFLFSHRYHWNMWHVFVSILACCVSRGIMIPMLSTLANWITSMQKYKNRCRGINKNSPATGVIVDRKMQMVLWFSGLRGAMSFALVEHIPLFDAVTGEGTRVKAELKAMTSASIMFTVFVLGGSTSYFMEYVGLAPRSGKSRSPNSREMTPLMANGRKKEVLNGGGRSSPTGHVVDMDNTREQKTRQRVRQKDDPER